MVGADMEKPLLVGGLRCVGDSEARYDTHLNGVPTPDSNSDQSEPMFQTVSGRHARLGRAARPSSKLRKEKNYSATV